MSSSMTLLTLRNSEFRQVLKFKSLSVNHFFADDTHVLVNQSAIEDQ